MSEQIQILGSDITVATFATFGVSAKYRDYSEQHESMSKSCLREGVPLLTYSFQECFSPGLEILSRPYPMRKGAGYWAWKPELIKNALSKSASRYILYVDVDLSIRRLDSLVVDSSFFENGVALFETREHLSDWCSTRCLRRFRLLGQGSRKIFSASVVLVDSQNSRANELLEVWDRALRDYRMILDPVFTFKTNHRHDQSVLSCLIATSKVRTSHFAQGFYQTGVDNGNQTVGSAWLVHGEIRSLSNPGRISRFNVWRSFLFHKYELVKFIISNFVSPIFRFVLKISLKPGDLE
jgi:hypothetical protein